MSFEPKPGMRINLNGESIEFLSLEATGPASVFVYAEAGKEGIVYKVLKNKKLYALKVFYPEYQDKRLIKNTEKLSQFKTLKGFAVAERTVINRKSFPQILDTFPELNYSVLMPWIQGTVWGNLILNKRPLRPEEYFQIAKILVNTLYGLESHGLAHCDLSNNNFIIDPTFSAVELIDIEDMYAPDMPRPVPDISYGTPGYRTKWIASNGLWDSKSDRFATAILSSEILTWHNKEIRDNRVGDMSFFDEVEIGEDSERFKIIKSYLGKLSADFPVLFEKAWFSKNSGQCPSVNDWMNVINNLDSSRIIVDESVISDNEDASQGPKVINGEIPHGVPPKMELSHSMLDFGVLQQSSNDLQVFIANIGGSVLTGNFILAPWLETSPSRFTIQPGDKRKIVVSIINGFPKPQSGLEYRALDALIIESNAGVEVIGARYKLAKPPFYKGWLGLLIVCLIGVIMFSIRSTQIAYQHNMNATGTAETKKMQATATKQEQYARATATKGAQNVQATATKKEQYARATASKQAQNVQATRTADDVFDSVPQGIKAEFPRVKFFETFSSNSNWNTSIENNDFYTGDKNINLGEYVWLIETANGGFIHWQEAPASSSNNFYLQVDANRVQGATSDVCYGLTFRSSSNGEYWFIVCDDKNFEIFYASAAADWKYFNGWSTSSAIRPDEVNRLGVSAQGNEIEFYINEVKVYTLKDNSSSSGTVGVSIHLLSAQSGNIHFDNFILLGP